jgi:hypothetical protein
MRILWLITFTWTLATCGVPAQTKPSPRPGWKLIKECGAEFYLPPDFKEEKVRGIDSCVKQYRGVNTLLELDVLGYITPDASRKDEYAEEHDVKYAKTKIDGRRAEIITHYATDLRKEAEGLNCASVLFVPQMRKDGGNLTIWTYSKSPEEREMAMKIFQTVRFPKE